MFVTNWISPTKIQKISEITNFFRHYFLSRTEVTFKISKDYEERHMEDGAADSHQHLDGNRNHARSD